MRRHIMNLRIVSGVLAYMAICPPGTAHHAAPAFFDLRATVSVEGTVTAHKLSNPHS